MTDKPMQTLIPATDPRKKLEAFRKKPSPHDERFRNAWGDPKAFARYKKALALQKIADGLADLVGADGLTPETGVGVFEQIGVLMDAHEHETATDVVSTQKP